MIVENRYSALGSYAGITINNNVIAMLCLKVKREHQYECITYSKYRPRRLRQCFNQ